MKDPIAPATFYTGTVKVHIEDAPARVEDVIAHA